MQDRTRVTMVNRRFVVVFGLKRGYFAVKEVFISKSILFWNNTHNNFTHAKPCPATSVLHCPKKIFNLINLKAFICNSFLIIFVCL